MSSLRNLIVFVGLFISVLVLGSVFGESLKSGEVVKSASTPSATTLKVEEAQKGGPKPLDYQLQGSKPKEQQAVGNLQIPQRTEQLQPNAKIKDFPANN